MARALTAGERALAAGMFAGAIDYDRVRIRSARWWPLQPANVCMAPDGDLWLPPAGNWPADFGGASLPLQALFIHEMTHVWQAQRGGRRYLLLARHPLCRYRYRLKPGKPFRRYGIEQQAEIVRHAWLARRGAGGIDPAGRDALEALLPFAGERPA